MPQHAVVGAMTRRTTRPVSTVLAWHDGRPRASFSTVRGWGWAALVAATLFWMSNPLVLLPNFDAALHDALLWTALVALLTLPWLRLPRVPWPWVAFLGLAALSRLWSTQSGQTDASVWLYLQVTVLALAVAANCRPEVVGWGMGVGGAVVTVLSVYAFEAGLPNAAYGGADGFILVGVGLNENILAYTVSIALAATLALGVPRRRLALVLWVITLAANAYGMYRASSGTGYLSALSVLLAAAAVLAWPALRRARRGVVLAWAGGAVALLTLGLLVVTVVLGKDVTTLSGRSTFWRATIDASLDRSPWLGSGWGAVWDHAWNHAPANEVADDIYARAGYYVPHGHSFFIDVLPQIGLIGVALAVVLVVQAVRETLRCGTHTDGRDPLAGRLILLVLVSLLVSGLTEPLLTAPLGWWSLALVVALPRQHLRFGLRRRGPRGRRVAGQSGDPEHQP
jgi:O-antigen ligase